MKAKIEIDGLAKDKFPTHYRFWGTIGGIRFESTTIHKLPDLSKKLGISIPKLKKLIQ